MRLHEALTRAYYLTKKYATITLFHVRVVFEKKNLTNNTVLQMDCKSTISKHKIWVDFMIHVYSTILNYSTSK